MVGAGASARPYREPAIVPPYTSSRLACNPIALKGEPIEVRDGALLPQARQSVNKEIR
jgi:hypothetical protein